MKKKSPRFSANTDKSKCSLPLTWPRRIASEQRRNWGEMSSWKVEVSVQ